MADNSTKVNDLVLSVVKIYEVKTSAKGTKYLNFKAVHEDGAEKTWFTCVAFKAMAKNMHGVLRKGGKIKVTGSVSQKEYQKKEGGVGLENKLIVDSAKVSTDDGVVTVDEFFEAKSDPF